MPSTTSRCRSCDSPLPESAAFCGTCGSRQDAESSAQESAGAPAIARLPLQVSVPELFDSPEDASARHSEAGTPAPAPAPAPSAWSRRPGNRTIGLVVLVVVILVAAVAGGLRVAGVGAGPTQAEKEATALKSLQATLLPQVESLMTTRATFFGAERKYLPAMRQIHASLNAFDKKTEKVRTQTQQIEAAYAPQFAACQTYVYVSCPDPDYPSSPDAPDLSDQIAQLNSVSKTMTTLHAQLVGAQSDPRLQPAYAQLLSAVDALGADAKENAQLLNDAITTPDGNGPGSVDDKKLTALNGNDALASIRTSNRTLVEALKSVELPLANYDVPGGQDVDPTDDSTKL